MKARLTDLCVHESEKNGRDSGCKRKAGQKRVVQELSSSTKIVYSLKEPNHVGSLLIYHFSNSWYIC